MFCFSFPHLFFSIVFMFLEFFFLSKILFDCVL